MIELIVIRVTCSICSTYTEVGGKPIDITDKNLDMKIAHTIQTQAKYTSLHGKDICPACQQTIVKETGLNKLKSD